MLFWRFYSCSVSLSLKVLSFYFSFFLASLWCWQINSWKNPLPLFSLLHKVPVLNRIHRFWLWRLPRMCCLCTFREDARNVIIYLKACICFSMNSFSQNYNIVLIGHSAWCSFPISQVKYIQILRSRRNGILFLKTLACSMNTYLHEYKAHKDIM